MNRIDQAIGVDLFTLRPRISPEAANAALPVSTSFYIAYFRTSGDRLVPVEFSSEVNPWPIHPHPDRELRRAAPRPSLSALRAAGGGRSSLRRDFRNSTLAGSWPTEAAARFPSSSWTSSGIPYPGDSARLSDPAILAADLSRPVILAEDRPDRYNLIDGHHRVARARRDGVPSIPGCRIRCPEHVAFLTSTRAYSAYVEYWNSKLDDAAEDRALRRRTRTHPASLAVVSDAQEFARRGRPAR